MTDETILSEVLAASLAGACSASALYPLEVIKTKMQAESKEEPANQNGKADNNSSVAHDTNVVEKCETKSNKIEKLQRKSVEPGMIAFAKGLYQTQGMAPFYAGIETSALQSATEKALYFFAYTSLKKIYTSVAVNDRKRANLGVSTSLILGCMAEWAHLPITLPLDCWTTKIQTSKGNTAPLGILMSMLSEKDGLKGMYKGIQAYTVLCLKPAIQYTIFEQVKVLVLARKRLLGKSKMGDEALTAIEAFLLGMVARTIATLAVFPYLRAKVMLQSQSNCNNREGGSNKPNIPGMITLMYETGGLSELFQGIVPELTRGIFSAALMLMIKEKISGVVKKALNG